MGVWRDNAKYPVIDRSPSIWRTGVLTAGTLWLTYVYGLKELSVYKHVLEYASVLRDYDPILLCCLFRTRYWSGLWCFAVTNFSPRDYGYIASFWAFAAPVGYFSGTVHLLWLNVQCNSLLKIIDHTNATQIGCMVRERAGTHLFFGQASFSNVRCQSPPPQAVYHHGKHYWPLGRILVCLPSLSWWAQQLSTLDQPMDQTEPEWLESSAKASPLCCMQDSSLFGRYAQKLHVWTEFLKNNLLACSTMIDLFREMLWRYIYKFSTAQDTINAAGRLMGIFPNDKEVEASLARRQEWADTDARTSQQDHEHKERVYCTDSWAWSCKDCQIPPALEDITHLFRFSHSKIPLNLSYVYDGTEEVQGWKYRSATVLTSLRGRMVRMKRLKPDAHAEQFKGIAVIRLCIMWAGASLIM